MVLDLLQKKKKKTLGGCLYPCTGLILDSSSLVYCSSFVAFSLADMSTAVL